MTATITSIYRYPVKGLSPEPLDAVDLEPGGAIAGDRRFALALASTRFDGPSPEWRPKSAFLALVKNEKLAALETRFDDASSELTILRNGRQVVHGKLADPVGRAIIEDFFAAYMGNDTAGKPHLAEARGDVIFTDQKDKLLSIINLNSVRDLQRIVGTEINPLRFRANIYIDGIKPWSEFDWIDDNITVGTTQLSVREKIDRCAAINVNPDDGARDQNLIKALQSGFGHIDMGIFARVTKGGNIRLGAPIGPDHT